MASETPTKRLRKADFMQRNDRLCRTCKYWGKWDLAPEDVGECNCKHVRSSTSDRDMPRDRELIARSTDDPLILTHANFGCVHHEPGEANPSPTQPKVDSKLKLDEILTLKEEIGLYEDLARMANDRRAAEIESASLPVGGGGGMLSFQRYTHKEAFCIMHYRCDLCRYTQRLWNSRDGVTPFIIDCFKCDGTAAHVSWNLDQCAPDFVPEIGMRIFVDTTKEMCIEANRKYVDRVWDSGDVQMKNDPYWSKLGKEGAVLELSKDWVRESPSVVVVDRDWKR